MKGWRLIKIVLIVLIVLALSIIYKKFDPSHNAGFPKCPSLLLTGYQCAGCGSQRAIHHLLNLEFGKALGINPLVVLLIGYVGVLACLEYSSLKCRFERLYNLLTGRVVLALLIITIILYSIVRNL